MTKRKSYTAEFKAKVAQEAKREELAKKYGLHQTMISGWKRAAIDNMVSQFGVKSDDELPFSQKEVEKLHAKFSHVVVEYDFLSEASSLILGAGGKKR